MGEFPNEDDARLGKMFTGKQGLFLRELLTAAGIDYYKSYRSYCFRERPYQNNPKTFYDKKGEVLDEWRPSLDRLAVDLGRYNPVVTICLGAVALKHLTGLTSIKKYRGTVLESPWGKAIATYTPGLVMAGQWHQRATVGKDFLKARIESGYREFVRPRRELWIRPTIEDLYEFEDKHMSGDALLSADIETDPWTTKQILCIGFAPDPSHAIVVPFMDKGVPGWSYWPTLDQEYEAYSWCRKHLEDPTTTLVGQNFLYDVQWLDRMFAIRCNPEECEDTMLMHHAMQPELEKGLGYLASTYTNEAAFKNMVSWAQNKKEA